jgi:hypothetical protein
MPAVTAAAVALSHAALAAGKVANGIAILSTKSKAIAIAVVLFFDFRIVFSFPLFFIFWVRTSLLRNCPPPREANITQTAFKVYLNPRFT